MAVLKTFKVVIKNMPTCTSSVKVCSVSFEKEMNMASSTSCERKWWNAQFHLAIPVRYGTFCHAYTESYA